MGTRTGEIRPDRMAGLKEVAPRTLVPAMVARTILVLMALALPGPARATLARAGVVRETPARVDLAQVTLGPVTRARVEAVRGTRGLAGLAQVTLGRADRVQEIRGAVDREAGTRRSPW